MKQSNINRRAIMSRAADLYRAITAEYPDSRNRTTWSECIREAWTVSAHRERNEWQQIPEAQQLLILRKMSRKAATRYEATTGACIPWGRIELDDVAAAAYIVLCRYLDSAEALNARREDSNKEHAPLFVIVYRAAAQALREELQNCIRNTTAVSLDDDCDGENSRSEYTPSTHDTERDALTRAALASLAPDAARLARYLSAGDTERQIAEKMQIGRATAHRRIEALRDDLRRQVLTA